MSKTILIVTDNLPEQINGVVTTYKNIEAMLIALATTKSRLPFPGKWARYLRRSLQIISTSPQRVLWVCVLDNILTNTIFATILLIILGFQKDLENFLVSLKLLLGL
jgi:hypothetical protein